MARDRDLTSLAISGIPCREEEHFVSEPSRNVST